MASARDGKKALDEEAQALLARLRAAESMATGQPKVWLQGAIAALRTQEGTLAELRAQRSMLLRARQTLLAENEKLSEELFEAAARPRPESPH